MILTLLEIPVRINKMAVYIYFAAGCLLFGIVLSFVVVFASYLMGIDIFDNIWILAIPVVLTVLLNILLIEIYLRRKKK
jgi:hypothetical protein